MPGDEAGACRSYGGSWANPRDNWNLPSASVPLALSRSSQPDSAQGRGERGCLVTKLDWSRRKPEASFTRRDMATGQRRLKAAGRKPGEKERDSRAEEKERGAGLVMNSWKEKRWRACCSGMWSQEHENRSSGAVREWFSSTSIPPALLFAGLPGGLVGSSDDVLSRSICTKGGSQRLTGSRPWIYDATEAESAQIRRHRRLPRRPEEAEMMPDEAKMGHHRLPGRLKQSREIGCLSDLNAPGQSREGEREERWRGEQAKGSSGG